MCHPRLAFPTEEQVRQKLVRVGCPSLLMTYFCGLGSGKNEALGFGGPGFGHFQVHGQHVLQEANMERERGGDPHNKCIHCT